LPPPRFFQALVIHGEALFEIFPENGGCPAPEFHAAGGANAVTYGEDEIWFVELNGALCFACAFDLNCQGFLDSCLPRQFSILKDVDQMERDVLFCGLKKLGDLDLGKPDGAILQT
jgi:hypothetical protein